MTSLEAAAAQAAKGDSRAFEAVCRALQDDVWRYCYALAGDRELAAEAAQETFLRSVRAIRRFRGEAPVRVWYLSLARRATTEVLRRARREPGVERGWPVEEVVPGPSVEAQLLVEQLPAELRQAFVLTQVLGLSYAETAHVTGCAVGTVRSRVFRARARLVAAWTGEPSEQALPLLLQLPPPDDGGRRHGAVNCRGRGRASSPPPDLHRVVWRARASQGGLTPRRGNEQSPVG